MWGRNLSRNMQKFLCFQLTVNIVICVITLIGGIYGHPPLNVIQMLWANLIMDILAAISLGTEPWKDKQSDSNSYEPSVNSSEKRDVQALKDSDSNLSMRIGRTDPILRPFIWQQVIVMAIWQILVLLVLMFFGGFMLGFDEAPNLVYTPLREPATLQATDRLVQDTFVYHVFILMNLFNMFNCRNIALDELNSFKTIFDNWIFLVVLVLEFFLQQLMVNSGSV